MTPEEANSVCRFDLQLSQQLFLVKNAQRDLQQSLSWLAKATSKDAKGMAKNLVRSKMFKAKYLLQMFQAVMEIRKELTLACRKLKQEHTAEYHHIKWLEQRLEKFLHSCKEVKLLSTQLQTELETSSSVSHTTGHVLWDILPLSPKTNFMESYSAVSSTYSEIISQNPPLETICKELQYLQKLIGYAARAATVQGELLPAISGPNSLRETHIPTDMKTSSGGSAKATTNLERECKALPKITDDSFARLVSIPEQYTQKGSRKLYGRMINFPRSVSTWNPSRKPSSLKHHRSKSVDSFMESAGGISRKEASKTSAITIQDNQDIEGFDVKKHKQQRICFLLEMLDSTNSGVRRSAAQAFARFQYEIVKQYDQVLIDKLLLDCDVTVQYLGMKSLLQLGIVNATVQAVVMRLLTYESALLQCDILRLLINLQQTHAHLDFSWCHSCLLTLLHGDHDELSLNAACILSYCQLERDKCIAVLLAHITTPTAPAHVNQALICLVKCWQVETAEVVSACTLQLQYCTDWKLRLSAVQLLRIVGKAMFSLKLNIFDMLVMRITNEPIQSVKQTIGELLKELELERKAEQLLLERLKSNDETTRADSAIALRAFELRSLKIAHILLDFFELDSSNYVRIQLIKTLGNLKCHSQEVLQRLAEKCNGTGTVMRECKAVLNKMKQSFGDE